MNWYSDGLVGDDRASVWFQGNHLKPINPLPGRPQGEYEFHNCYGFAERVWVKSYDLQVFRRRRMFNCSTYVNVSPNILACGAGWPVKMSGSISAESERILLSVLFHFYLSKKKCETFFLVPITNLIFVPEETIASETAYVIMTMPLLNPIISPSMMPAAVVKGKGLISLQEGYRIKHDICKAVLRLEQEGFCHRDITPTNIAVNGSYYCLLDSDSLGLLSTGDPHCLKHRGGTFSFSATPELVNVTEPVPSRWGMCIDIWGIGTTLFFLLTGKLCVGSAARETGNIAACLDDLEDKALVQTAVRRGWDETLGEEGTCLRDWIIHALSDPKDRLYCVEEGLYSQT